MTLANDPAFPVPGFNDDPSTPERFVQPCVGMTLRQWYAGQAMQGLCHIAKESYIDDPQSLASDAVATADALIKELEKTT